MLAFLYVISIGILDYTLFPEHPEFYATYELTNTKNRNIFTDKLTIHVLDLTQIELDATNKELDAANVKNAMLTEEIAELQARIRALEERE